MTDFTGRSWKGRALVLARASLPCPACKVCSPLFSSSGGWQTCVAFLALAPATLHFQQIASSLLTARD